MKPGGIVLWSQTTFYDHCYVICHTIPAVEHFVGKVNPETTTSIENKPRYVLYLLTQSSQEERERARVFT